MDSIVGVMKRVAEHEVQRIHTTELGIVTAVFPHAADDDKDNYHCSVKLKQHRRPDGQPLELRNVPVATPYMGLACIPNVGDLVLVNFIGGSINAPVITGRLYNDEDRPPKNKKNEFLLQHTIKEGGSIKVDAEGRILITSKNEKNVLTVEDDKISLVNEKYSLVIDVKGNKITISADQDVEVSAAKGKLMLSGQEVEIKSQSNLRVSAQQNIDLKATSQMTVEGTAGATLKNAAAKVALSGPTVNINNGALEIT
jgi:uncharacterized protein involved in type VI secretion and phage assembly